MNEVVIGVYGASGFGREVLPAIRSNETKSNAKIVFIDDGGSSGDFLNGHPVYNWDHFSELNASKKSVAIAIADADTRYMLAERCESQQISAYNVAASNVFVGDNVSIAEGYILQPFVTLTSNIIIGKYFHANIYSYVAHDCIIGDYVTFAPGVMCNGNVHIEDRAYIGTGAVLKQGTADKPLVIGAGATVGMGAVVTKDVPPGVTVVGNPARIMEKK